MLQQHAYFFFKCSIEASPQWTLYACDASVAPEPRYRLDFAMFNVLEYHHAGLPGIIAGTEIAAPLTSIWVPTPAQIRTALVLVCI